MQIYLKTLGCRLNEAETESWAQGFEAKGHSVISEADTADMLIINTCAVTQTAVKKSRQLIRKTHRNNPTAKLVVSGCYTALNEQLQQEINGIDLIVSNHDKDKLVDIALKKLNCETMPALSTEPGEAAIFKRGRNRAFIKIQDGCRYRCTFCIVTVIRGKERNRQIHDIIEQINAIHQQGVQEVILTGVHIGGYGSDTHSSLYTLIKHILSNTDIPRIRLASVEPWDLPQNFFELFSNKRLMPHLHLPLQSGCDSVLKRMARRCKKNDFRDMIDDARNEIDHFNLTTDIIVGFPGESEEEWQESLSFIEEIGFSHIHIFTYSERKGTKAATLPNPVAPEIKKERSRMLHALMRQMRQQFLSNYIGISRPVLWESVNDNIWTGYTDNFIQMKMHHSQSSNFENRITQTRITSINNETQHCIGELV